MILRRDIFQALADPNRRAILILLASKTITAGEISGNFDAARSTISKHIQILTECGLIEAEQKGREIYYSFNMEKMQEVDIWMDQLKGIWEARFDRMDDYMKKVNNNKK